MNVWLTSIPQNWVDFNRIYLNEAWRVGRVYWPWTVRIKLLLLEIGLSNTLVIKLLGADRASSAWLSSLRPEKPLGVSHARFPEAVHVALISNSFAEDCPRVHGLLLRLVSKCGCLLNELLVDKVLHVLLNMHLQFILSQYISIVCLRRLSLETLILFQFFLSHRQHLQVLTRRVKLMRYLLWRLRWVKSHVLQLLGWRTRGKHKLLVSMVLVVKVRVKSDGCSFHSWVFLNSSNLVLQSLFRSREHYVF